MQQSQRGLSVGRQKEGSKKKTKALSHSLLMAGSNSFKNSNTERRTPSNQNKTHKKMQLLK